MKGNFQVRFLEGGGLATARLYSAGAVITVQYSVFSVRVSASPRLPPFFPRRTLENSPWNVNNVNNPRKHWVSSNRNVNINLNIVNNVNIFPSKAEKQKAETACLIRLQCQGAIRDRKSFVC